MITDFIKSFSTLFCLTMALFLTSCNTTDTGISKPFPDCYDGIKNQDETGIDCGGSCVPCPAKVTAKIDGIVWESGGNVAGSVSNNQLLISSGNGTSNLSLIHQGPF